MGSFTYEDLPDRPPVQGVWSARIAKTLTDFADLAEVVIPGIDENLRWTKCKWQSRNDVDLPQRGNYCLVAFDDNNEVVVVMWWPF